MNKLDPRIFCNHCRKPLTPGEMVEMWCEGCRRPTTADDKREAA